jgi:hypothetical protein
MMALEPLFFQVPPLDAARDKIVLGTVVSEYCSTHMLMYADICDGAYTALSVCILHWSQSHSNLYPLISIIGGDSAYFCIVLFPLDQLTFSPFFFLIKTNGEAQKNE